MNSCLYECQIMHARLSPRSHRFVYRIFLFAIDLDELDEVDRRVSAFSLGRPNLYSFRDADYFPSGEALHNADAAAAGGRQAPPPGRPGLTLKQRVMAQAVRHGVDVAGGRVILVTLPRVLGFLFNPVSFYFCYDRQGTPVAAIAEVTNTFREMKSFFLGSEAFSPGAGGFQLRLPKHFYVSPYSDVDVAFDFTLRPPESQLAIQIDDYTGAHRTLTTLLTGERRPLTNPRLIWFSIKYPFITLRVIFLIHWHALLLWFKRVPWFAKSARSSEQRDLYRPHHSLLPPSPSDPA